MPLQREPVQESEPTGQACEIVGQYQQANGNNEGAAEHFDSAKMSLESAVEGKELIQAKAGDEEGESQTHRIDTKQENSFRHRLLRAGDG